MKGNVDPNLVMEREKENDIDALYAFWLYGTWSYHAGI